MAKYSEAALASPLFGDYTLDEKQGPQSLLFAPAFQFSSDSLSGPQDKLKRRREDTLEDPSADPAASASTSTSRATKRVKIDNLVSHLHQEKPTLQSHISPTEQSPTYPFLDPCV
jgi:hypothetical protein